VRDTFDRVREQLREQGYEQAAELPVGVMIEVPASVWVLPELIQEVDFVSVGTNDLTQYVLAADRDNPFVAKLYDPHHPAIMRVLARIAEVCREAGKPCSVCGELAGDLAATLGLLGMGYSAVSAAPNFLAELRFAVRHTTEAEARELAEGLATATTSQAVADLLAAQHRRLYERLDTSGTTAPGA
jgi:phosphotransferase system enzyme I (PtsP)